MRTKKVLFLLLILILIIGCGMARHRKYIRDGIFISGLSQFAFLEEWEKPDKQGTWAEEGGQYRITYGLRGSELTGRRKAFNDVWIYYKQNKILFFSNYRLMAHYDWDEYQKAERERKKLPAIMK